ncbi:cold-inducible protein YdjO-related protein [Paenibacillus thailandensis]|uniref:cold-inducible protein YdjO-related protein n=1 Tax=Paenibacillus thailandensis TaxID=393250 RepID=UPI00363BC6D6
MAAKEDTPVKLIATKIWRCKNQECKAWVRDEFSSDNPSCPMCKGPMGRSIRHLPAVQNKVKSKPRKPKQEW